jgi:hypothetical protein
MSETADHDAVLRVVDGTDRIGKKIIGWKWDDGRPTISLDENAEANRLIEQAEEKAKIDNLDHGTILARIWMDGESVSQIEWDERYDPPTDELEG